MRPGSKVKCGTPCSKGSTKVFFIPLSFCHGGFNFLFNLMLPWAQGYSRVSQTLTGTQGPIPLLNTQIMCTSPQPSLYPCQAPMAGDGGKVVKGDSGCWVEERGRWLRGGREAGWRICWGHEPLVHAHCPIKLYLQKPHPKIKLSRISRWCPQSIKPQGWASF